RDPVGASDLDATLGFQFANDTLNEFPLNLIDIRVKLAKLTVSRLNFARPKNFRKHRMHLCRVVQRDQAHKRAAIEAASGTAHGHPPEISCSVETRVRVMMGNRLEQQALAFSGGNWSATSPPWRPPERRRRKPHAGRHALGSCLTLPAVLPGPVNAVSNFPKCAEVKFPSAAGCGDQPPA